MMPGNSGLCNTIVRFLQGLFSEKLFLVCFPLVAGGMTVHFFHSIDKQTASDFGLAAVSATIGGLVMVGGFLDRADKPKASQLVSVGKWYLVAAVFLTLFGLFMPWLACAQDMKGCGERLVFAATVLSMGLATFAFAWATTLLIPRLWRLGEDDAQEQKGCERSGGD